VISCRVDTDEDEVAELFDKYNLRALPVVNSGEKLVGIVEADDVISFLRGRS
jgi:magnesium transporter